MQDKLWLSTISVGCELVLMPYGNFAAVRQFVWERTKSLTTQAH